MIKTIGKPDLHNFDAHKYTINITGKAKLHLKNLILWCEEHASEDPLSGTAS